MSETMTHVQTSITAVLSMVFGLLAWFALPFLGAIVAVIFGHAARREIRRSNGLIDGDGLAMAGLTLGWTNIVVWLGLVLIFFGMLGLASGFFAGPHWIEQLHNNLCKCTMRV